VASASAAEVARQLQQVAELHALVAADAGDRRLAGERRLSANPSITSARKHLLAVEHVVRDAEPLGHAARVVDVLAGAAGARFCTAAPWS
jgi:hypothetical protein